MFDVQGLKSALEDPLFQQPEFHTSGASGLKNGQSDQKRNCAILA